MSVDTFSLGGDYERVIGRQHRSLRRASVEMSWEAEFEGTELVVLVVSVVLLEAY